MKNLFTNLMKNTAKRTQNTGGGASHEKNSAVTVWNDSRTTVNRRSNDGQSQRQYTLGLMKYAAMMALLLTLVCGNAWGASVTFTSGTGSGQINVSSGSGDYSLTSSPVTLNVKSPGAKTQNRQIWSNSGSAQSEQAFQLSSSADATYTGKHIEVTVDSGYTITGLTVRGAISSTTAGTYVAYCWADTFSTSSGAVTGTGSLAFPGYNVSTSAGANISMTGIVSGTRTIRIYKRVKYDSTNKRIDGTNGSNNPSSAPGSLNVASITVTYIANPTFSESAGAELTQEEDAVTLTSAGNTIYYKWSTNSSAYAVNAGATLAGAKDGSGTSPVDATAPSGTGTYYLYAVAKDESNNYSAVVKRSYTITAAGGGCEAPTSPSISGTTSYTAGGTISLTASATGTDESTTYQWYKGDPADSGVSQGDASTGGATFSKASCVVADAGTYYCVISNGAGCEVTTYQAITVAKADMPSTGLATGTATSITASGATLPFTMTSTSGVGSLTIKVYTSSDDKVAKTISNITPATSGSQAVTGLSASTTYYYTITPIGDANHNDGDETSASSTFTTLEPDCSAPTSPSISGTTSYTAGGTISLTASATGTDESTTYQWYKGDPADSGVSQGDASTDGATFTIAGCEVADAGTYYCVISNGAGCDVTTYQAITVAKASMPSTGLETGTATSITTSGATLPFTMTSTSGVGSLTIKVYKNSDNSLVETISNVTAATSSSADVTGLDAGTTYYYTITPIGDANHNDGSETSASSTFTTLTVTYTVTYSKGSATGGTAPTDATLYSSGAEVTVKDTTGCKFVYAGYTFRGWTDGTTFFLPGQKFEITANTTLTAVWEGASGGSYTYTFESSKPGNPLGTYFDITTSAVSGHTYEIASSLNSNNIKASDLVGGGSYFLGGTISTSNVSATYKTKASYTNIDSIAFYENANDNGKPTYVFKVVDASSGTALYTSTTLDHKTIKGSNGTNTWTGRYRLDLHSAPKTGKIQIDVTSGSTTKYYALDNITVYYKGNDTNFDVSFNMKGHGSAISSYVGVPNGKQIVAPAAPTASGYIFGGWYTDTSCTSAWNWGSSTVSKDTTLYAKWTEKSTPAGTTLTPTASSVCSGSSTTLTLNASTSGVEYELYEGETKLRTVTGTGSALSLGSTSNLTAAKTYTVKTVENEDYKGMTLAVEATVSIATATSVSVASTSLAATVGEAFTIDGITASGTGDLSYQWYSYTTSGGAGESLIAGAESDSYTFTPDATGSYYFKCAVTGDCGSLKSDMITVTATDLFDITMGTHANGSFTIKVGSADAVSTSTASCAGATIAIAATPSSGYVFKNWEILDGSDDDITTTVGATAADVSTSFMMPSEAVTINAVFVATHTVTVTYGAGGSAASAASSTVGETLTTTITATAATGYNFSAWEFTSNTGSATLDNTASNPATLTMGTANVTVNATFSAKTYSVSLDQGIGSSGSENVTMTYNSSSHTSITAPTAPTGYTFAGWYTAAGGTGSMVMNASGVLQASVDGYTDGSANWTKDATTTLYAKYTANYPNGYLYITDVMATPETKASYTITASATDAAYDGALDGSFSHSGLQHWAKASAKNTGVYTLTFSDALTASATAAGVAVDVWWGVDNESNAGTEVYINGTSASDKIGYQKSSGASSREVLLDGLKNLQAVGTTSVSSLQLKCTDNPGATWFRIGIKDIPGYKLTYDDGDGSGAPSASYQPNATIKLSSTAPTRSGYVFRGWQVGGAGIIYAPGASFSMPAAAVTLVAKWDGVCMNFAAATSGSSETPAGTAKEISTASGGYASALSGGSMTFLGRVGVIGCNNSYGLVFDSKDDELLTVTLSGAMLEAGAIIVLDCYSVNTNSTEVGFTISSNACNEGIYTTTAAAYQRFTRTYVVAENDGIDGTSTFTIKGATTNKVYLKGMTVAGCTSCTSISPSLSYDKTTIWVGESGATPNLNKDGSTGSVTYVSNNTDVARVNESTGVITAVARGTATITATIAADATHCGKSTTCDITVKDMTCGITTIAKATRSGASASYTGVDGGSALVNNLDGSNYKLKSGGYVGVQLPSTLSFEAGDSVRIDLTIGDWWNSANVDELPVVVYADNTGTNEIYRTDNYTKLTAQVVEFEVTSSMLTALATKQVTVYRQSTNPVTQNHVVNSVEVKRYGCPDVYYFNTESTSGAWSDEENWLGPAGQGGGLPTIDDRIVINKPMTVDIAHAAAAEVILDQNGKTGKLTIEPNMGLEVAGTVQVYNGSSYGPTTPADLVLESSADGNASLIFNNNNECQATVQMYSIASISGDWNWQFMGIPFTTTSALYSYYDSYLYEWNAGGYWDAVANGGTMEAFKGYCITQDAPAMYVMGGTLNPTSSDKEITIPANKEFVMANSWSAPISVCNFTETTLPLTDKTIYLFNTGHNESGATEGTAAGTYVAMPINSAIYTGNYLIAPMEGFYVDNTSGSAATITLKYDELVRPSGSHTDIVAGPMHAPRRVAATEEPAVMKLKATGSRYSERVVILEREDFSAGFDNGWDGKNLNEPGVAPILYALREDGTKDAVSAIPTYEGTVVGFRNGEDNFYTFSFEYDGEDNWYLNDLKEQKSTLIHAAETYEFVAEPGDTEARFVISATPIHKIATGNESTGAEAAKVRKLIINDKLYIIRGGRMYSVDGQMIK